MLRKNLLMALAITMITFALVGCKSDRSTTPTAETSADPNAPIKRFVSFYLTDGTQTLPKSFTASSDSQRAIEAEVMAAKESGAITLSFLRQPLQAPIDSAVFQPKELPAPVAASTPAEQIPQMAQQPPTPTPPPADMTAQEPAPADSTVVAEAPSQQPQQDHEPVQRTRRYSKKLLAAVGGFVILLVVCAVVVILILRKWRANAPYRATTKLAKAMGSASFGSSRGATIATGTGNLSRLMSWFKALKLTSKIVLLGSLAFTLSAFLTGKNVPFFRDWTFFWGSLLTVAVAAFLRFMPANRWSRFAYCVFVGGTLALLTVIYFCFGIF